MIPVIDLFAGPGGLNEGFAGFLDARGEPVFASLGAFEMDHSAVSTLTLRAAYRRAQMRKQDDSYYRFLRNEISFDQLSDSSFGAHLEAASSHVHQIELGPENRHIYSARIAELLRAFDPRDNKPWILVGGPPCQAYSLVGRSRRANDDKFEADKKHFLYREYLHILATQKPPLFVMENVKGLLSSTHGGTRIFERIMADLARPGFGVEYEIHSLVSRAQALDPRDFVTRSEQFGIPQARHRLILVGVRKGTATPNKHLGQLNRTGEVTVTDAIGSMPALRSGITPVRDDGNYAWHKLRDEQFLRNGFIARDPSPIADLTRGARYTTSSVSTLQHAALARFMLDPKLEGLTQHVTRSHMRDDLRRYFYAAAFAEREGRSPKLSEFPPSMLPRHKNATSELRPFEDRFRVQVGGKPSSTVVSHIAKDGHYFIHPDPTQMRSLTVREAARLQTFPDNYYFMGNRTQQYTQVGNAVPPLLARKIAEVIYKFLN